MVNRKGLKLTNNEAKQNRWFLKFLKSCHGPYYGQGTANVTDKGTANVTDEGMEKIKTSIRVKIQYK